MTQAATVIRFEGISKVFAGGHHPALDRVSLAVGKGEFLALVGASGSGKTTLLRLINRLTEPSSGSVRVEGADVREVDPVKLRRGIGYVFQAITPKLLGWDNLRTATRIDEMLDLVRLDRAHHRNRFPHELSGGERQRVGVARALAAQPGIILMDEPFGALDPPTRDALQQDYRRLHDELGLTTVMITHDTLEAVLLADRILVLQAGRVVADGPPQALLTSEQSAYVRDLMQMPRRQAERLQTLMDGRPAP
jgi:osmoprotectant transport system ATP-binding protein